MPDFWGVATIAAKFAVYLGILTAVGMVLVSWIFQLKGQMRGTVQFAILGITATILTFMLGGAMLSGEASGMLDPKLLCLLWSTSVGTVLALRLLGLSLLIIGLFIGRVGRVLSLIGAILALWSFVHTGHIPDHGSWMLNLVLMFHLIAISIWIGILSPLRRLSLNPKKASEAADLGHRFGQMATVFVPLMIFAGVFMGYELLGSWSALLGTGYGQVLILKIVFVAGLLALAAINKLRFIPQLAAGNGNAAAHLAKSISFEWLAVFAILLTTAVLTSSLTLPS